MDPDKLRNIWQQIDIDGADIPVPRLSRRSVSGLARTRRMYRTVMVISFLWVALFPLCCRATLPLPLWVSVAGSVFFMLMGLMLWRIYSEVRAFDPADSNVVESLQRICRIESLRRSHRMVGYLLAVPLLVVMLYYFSDSLPMLWGGIAGAAVGFAIGLHNDRRTARWIASVRAELKDTVCK